MHTHMQSCIMWTFVDTFACYEDSLFPRRIIITNAICHPHPQILWSNTSLVGCASMSCPRLVLPPGSVAVRTSAIFLVCYYDPAYIAGLPVYTALEELDPPCGGRCPVFAPDCLSFRSSGSDGGELFDDEDPSLCGGESFLPPSLHRNKTVQYKRKTTFKLSVRYSQWNKYVCFLSNSILSLMTAVIDGPVSLEVTQAIGG